MKVSAAAAATAVSVSTGKVAPTIAGAAAAAMSTLDSILHANMTVLTRDLYQRYLSQRPKADGSCLSPQTQGKKLMAVARFCRWMVRERILAVDPSAELEMPRRQLRLPKAVLTLEEVEPGVISLSTSVLTDRVKTRISCGPLSGKRVCSSPCVKVLIASAASSVPDQVSTM